MQDDWVAALEKLDTKKLGKKYRLGKFEIEALEQRREDLILAIKYNGMEELFESYAKNADGMDFGTFDRSIFNKLKKRQLMEED
jgi:hypothetical protein